MKKNKTDKNRGNSRIAFCTEFFTSHISFPTTKCITCGQCGRPKAETVLPHSAGIPRFYLSSLGIFTSAISHRYTNEAGVLQIEHILYYIYIITNEETCIMCIESLNIYHVSRYQQ